MIMRFSLFVCLFAWLPFFQARAQDLPDVAQGLQPYVAYHGGDFDQINMLNGALSIRIPLLSYPQKGSSLSLSYSLQYNTTNYQTIEQCSASPGGGGPLHTFCPDMNQPLPSRNQAGFYAVMDQVIYAGGSEIPDPNNSTVSSNGRFYVIEPNGSQHPLAPTADGYRSLDDSGYLFVPPAGTVTLTMPDSYGRPQIGGGSGAVTDSHGITYTLSQAGFTITDRDSNSIVVDSSSNTIDSALRPIPPPPNSPVANDLNIGKCPALTNAQYQPIYGAATWTVPGPGGSVNYVFCFATVNIATHFPGLSDPNPAQYVGALPMLQSVVLPNGRYWAFIYDSLPPGSTPSPTAVIDSSGLGLLHSLVYPTGGSVGYSYTENYAFCDSIRDATAIPGVTMTTYQSQVQYRTESDSSGQLGQWMYSPANGPGPSQMITPAGNLTQTYFVQDPNVNNCAYVESQQEVYQGSSTGNKPLKSTLKKQTFLGVNGLPQISIPRDDGSVTTLADGSSSSIAKSYALGPASGYLQCDQGGSNCGAAEVNNRYPLGSPTLVTYVNYDSTILRQDSIKYKWQEADSNYLNANLLDIASTVSVEDAVGNPLASTTYSYDEANYSPGGIRGHQTTAARMLDTNDGLAPVTHTSWNGSGQVTASTDANGNTTTYSYQSLCGDWILSGTTNALGQTRTGVYDCPTGLLTSLTDLNLQVTGVAYDNMRRIHSVTYPSFILDTGVAASPITNFYYHDEDNTAVRDVSGAPNPDQHTKVVFDGFGRELYRYSSDPSGEVIVKTTYDGDGRVSSVSNPYRTPLDATYGVVAMTYDALNRKILVTEPGPSTLQTQYTGPTVDTWDEASTHMQHTSDASGRLVKVMELGNAANPVSLETDYVYNLRGDLTDVNQHGSRTDTLLHRCFHYDSLSRLTSAYNPETGTISYNLYDGEGNLQNKTDARGVTDAYRYDALNRMNLKISSDGTFPVIFSYDGVDEYGNRLPFSLNSIGRLTHTSNGTNAASNYSYDALGHLAQKSDCVPDDCSYDIITSAKYDLAGNMTDLIYPDGFHLTQAFDPAGHLRSSGWSDGVNGSSPQAYVQSLTYLPDGSPNVLTLGNAIQQVTTKNNRLQVASMSIVDPLPTVGALGPVEPFLSRIYCYVNCPSGGIGNNGNIWSIFDTLHYTPYQDFTYDELNRIASYKQAGLLQQTYTTDSFGNLSPGAGQGVTYTFDPATNRIVNLPCFYLAQLPSAFDVSGNQKCDQDQYGAVRLYSYDAENRITGITMQNNQAAGPFETYSYNPEGQRVRKVNANGHTTDYAYFNGQPIAEKDQTGAWTDYVYANGQKIAKITPNASIMHFSGTTPYGIECDARFNVPSYVVKPGDVMTWHEFKNGIGGWTVGGPNLWFASGATTLWHSTTTDGSIVNQNYLDGAWATRSLPLFEFVGEQLTAMSLLHDVASGAAQWDIWVGDLVIVSADGTVTPIFTADSQLSIAGFYCQGTSSGLDFESDTAASAPVQSGPQAGQTPVNTQTVNTVEVRLLNASCTQCGGPPVGVGLRSVAVGSVSVGNTTLILPDPSVTDDNGCNSGEFLYCDGAKIIPISGTGPVTLMLTGNPDGIPAIYPVVEVIVNGVLAQVTGPNGGSPSTRTTLTSTTQAYTTAPPTGASTYFMLSDHLGSASMEFASGGTPTSVSQFGPFGAEITMPNATSHYKFTGKERDAESGLDYFGARYYASNMGRWMSPDWAEKPEAVPYSSLDNPQSLNLYGYVNNNPLSKADKDGHCPDACVVEGISAGVIVGVATVGAAAAYLATPSGQRSLSTFTSAFSSSVSSSVDTVKGWFSSSSSTPAPATTSGSHPEIVIDGNQHPESAQHAADAQAAGHPADVTIDRGGAAGNRADALRGTPAVPGAHRDEYPPAVTTQGGSGASVRPISPSDNAGAGASMGNQMRPYPNGTTVTIKPINVPNPPQ